MNTVIAKRKLTDKEANELLGTFLDENSFDTLIERDTEVKKENGDFLLVFRKKILPLYQARDAYQALRKAAPLTDNRGIAAGEVDSAKIFKKHIVKQGYRKIGKFRLKTMKQDGTESNTMYANTVNSGVIGYFDRYPRFPYCRQTAFNLDHFEEYKKAYPYIKSIDDKFKELVPERYKIQRKWTKDTSKDFIIKDTAFTTVTVNKNFRTAVHTDKGDLKEGFGNLAVLEAGKYQGGYLVFPQYRIAVNVRTTDLLLMDVHELHGNTEIIGITKRYERISLVCYYRRNMIECKSAQEELLRAKQIYSNRILKD